MAISSIDLYFLRREFEELINCKVDKIFQVDKDIILQLHSPKLGKLLLKIIPGTAIFLTNFKQETKLTGFATKLRKHLGQSKLLDIKQTNFERILELKFQKEETFYLIIELFGKGNIILCDSDYQILSCLETEEWKTRTTKVNETYEYPPQHSIDLEEIDLEAFSAIVRESNKHNLVKKLAMDLGIGGSYAEEICFLAKVDKNKEEATDSELKLLFNKLKQVLKEKINANIAGPSIFPIEMKHLPAKKFFKNYNEGLNEYYTKTDPAKIKFEEKLKSLRDTAAKQFKKVVDSESDVIEYKKIGDIIYKNFNLIENILKQINESKWKFNDKIILEKKPGENKIVVELE